jgi:hypothetical protein
MPSGLGLVTKHRSTTTSSSFKGLARLRMFVGEESYEIRWVLGKNELVLGFTHMSNYFKLRKRVKGRSQTVSFQAMRERWNYLGKDSPF